MYKLHNLKNNKKKAKRVGRGESSGKGKTSTRGHGGQGAHGKDMPKGFEGGQTPFKWRMPKLRGFKRPYGSCQAVSLKKISSKFEAGDKINPKSLKKSGLIKELSKPIKIIGNKIEKKLVFEDVLFSKGASKAVGGKSKAQN